MGGIMGFLKKIVAWVAKKLSKDQKAKLFDVAVDKWAGESKKPEREVIGPRQTFVDRGPSDRIEKRKVNPNKRGK